MPVKSCVPDFLEVRIENTNACGYKCVMCPRDKQTREQGYMTLEDFSVILDRIPDFKGGFHLHGFGEPLLDRNLADKIQLAKSKFPGSTTTIFSTLGVKAREGLLEKLGPAGLDYIFVSWYGFTKEAYQKVHKFDGFDLAKKNLEFLSKKIKEHNSRLTVVLKIPHQEIYSALPMAQDEGGDEFVQWAEDLGCIVQFWGSVHNYGDGRSYNAPSCEKSCPVITGKRRNILTITWDLHVIPCSLDYNATIKFGNLRESTLEEIFSGPAYLNFVSKHKLNQLSSFPVCQNCEKDDVN